MVGGLLLIVASFLPYGYDWWASDSTFDLTRYVFNNLTDTELMSDFLKMITPSLGESAFLVALVVASFLLLFLGGIVALLKTGGGSVAGPAAMIILTLIPIYLGDTGEITSLGTGYFLGWVGSVVCVVGDMGRHRDRQRQDKHHKQKKSNYDQYYDDTYGDDFEPYESDTSGDTGPSDDFSGGDDGGDFDGD